MHEQPTLAPLGFATTEEAAAYLSAMIDGEGHVEWNREGNGYMRRVVTIVNTDEDLITACGQACAKLSIRYRVHRGGQGQPHWAPWVRLYIGGPTELRKLAAVVTLRSRKKREALVAAAMHRGKAERLHPDDRPITEVRRLYDIDGESLVAIAKRFDRNPDTIAKWIREDGGQIRTLREAQRAALAAGRHVTQRRAQH